jgi:transglycosylase-like protein
MDEGFSRREAASTRTRGRAKLADRPDRIALWAFVLAILAMVMAAASAHAGSGGTTLASGSPHESRYHKLWDQFNHRDHRWAHKTSYCESGGDPRAIGGGGVYRGAFQFTRDAWKTSPKSPGGDPIRYSWKTQAVVAVLLKHRDGTRPWPVCG